jgi:ATP adenylyltransferase
MTSDGDRSAAGRPLWAPWRLEYVRADKSGRCPFCDAAAQGDDRRSLVVERGVRCVTMLNAYPYASGHVMVLPRRHVAQLQELDAEEVGELMQLTQRAIRALSEAMAPHGFNVGLNLGEAAGAGVADHLHQHVVPRWSGDTNFMPVIADTRVLPEALEATRARLAAVLARLA